MRTVGISFRQMLLFLKNDMMLAVACISPILIGVVFRFGIPQLEVLLTDYFRHTQILMPYYPVFDLFLACIIPTFYCFVAAMVILEERDDRITAALYASPLGRNGYFISRLGVPGMVAFLMTVCMLTVFSLTGIAFVERLLLSLNGTLQGIVFSLLIVTLSSNKLEGMAVTKLTSLMMLGVAVPWFVPQKVQPVFFFLPTFWMGKAVWEGQLVYTTFSVVCTMIWLGILKEKARKTLID